MSFIISSLQTIGLFSGAYVGYKHGFIYKTSMCGNSFFKKYDDLYINPNFNDTTMSENTFYDCIGLFSGLIAGYYLYPIMIPTMLYHLQQLYPDQINQLKKYGIK
jgi:hypothetical protein